MTIEGPYLILSRLGQKEELYLPCLFARDLIDAYNRLASIKEPDPRLLDSNPTAHLNLKEDA